MSASSAAAGGAGASRLGKGGAEPGDGRAGGRRGAGCRDGPLGLTEAGTGLIARGAGRSYGDAAQCAGGTVLDMNGFDRIISIDTERLTVTAQAGATLAGVMAALADTG